ncbi:MAG: hypothetical protein CMH54_05235 [Myxococcales bacterium]|nr:hypothetical protein [Myxococcales bacterium]|tara:strand:- start:544 stop:1011 length:468 start_codon:yes stop_codon:yes gene_type:complete
MGEPSQNRPIELLLVEDNAADVALTEEAFEESSRSVTIVHMDNGADALSYLQKEAPHTDRKRPDIILLDLNLPRLDGWGVLDFVKSNPELRTIPVVVLTTSIAPTDIARAYSLHANAYMAKPFDLQQFFDLIHNFESFWFDTVTLPTMSESESGA